MNNIFLRKVISEMQLGAPVSFKNLYVVPTFNKPSNASFPYLSMKAAIEQKVLELTEVSANGIVATIRATNSSILPILLIDGEAIIGAKQNRIINTTILLAPQKQTLIPVSCTEQGRWQMNNPTFMDSGEIMPAKARYSKSHKVYNNIMGGKGFLADQQAIWEDVSKLSYAFNVDSSTQSMKDVFTHNKDIINEYLQVFKIQKNQTGLIVFSNGQLAGFDYISLPTMYSDLHEKLLKSHIMDAITNYQSEYLKVYEQVEPKSFLEELTELSFTKHSPIGLGTDYRFEGKQNSATILMHREQIIHWAAFPKTITTTDLRRSI